jgi:hypothetical protein
MTINIVRLLTRRERPSSPPEPRRSVLSIQLRGMQDAFDSVVGGPPVAQR